MLTRLSKYLLVVLALSMAGCIKDDTSDCGPSDRYNLTLLFRYYDSAGNEKFSQHIDEVTVYLFDENKNYAGYGYADNESLSEFCGIRFELDPGLYHIVCWGNISGQEEPSGFNMEDAYMSYGAALFESPVFYAPRNTTTPTRSVDEEGLFTVNLPEDRKEVVETIEFMETSRPVTVTVIGLEDNGPGGALNPDVEITNLPEGYDFIMNLYGRKGSYNRNASTVPEKEKTTRAVFHTPYFEVEDDMILSVYRKSNGVAEYTGTLRAILEQAGADPRPDEPIEIEIEFRDGKVTITVIGYTSKPVVPDL